MGRGEALVEIGFGTYREGMVPAPRKLRAWHAAALVVVLLFALLPARDAIGEDLLVLEDVRQVLDFSPRQRALANFEVAAEPLEPSGRAAPWPPFRTSTPEAEGMDGSLLAAAFSNANEIPNLYSLLVVRHRAIVGEQYFDEPTRTTATATASVGKSIVSALVGIAIEEGFLVDLDQRMIDFFPEYDVAELDSRKRDITIRHLIQMRAGYPNDHSAEFFDAVTSSPDWMRFIVVDWALERAPGDGWAYSNASTHLVSGILTKATGMSLLELANRYLFGRMSQPIEEWPTDPQGYCWGIGYVYCTPLQLASFGQMVLDRGVWRGRRILATQWVSESLEPISEVPEDNRIELYDDIRYGFLWWHAEVGGREVSYARGHGGQFVFVVHSLDLVVVSTAYDYGNDYSDTPWQTTGPIMELIAAEVIPAAE